MNNLNLTLSNLIGSRICYELISPIGTINNGLELIELKGDPVSSEISSIEQSSAVAAARIQFSKLPMVQRSTARFSAIMKPSESSTLRYNPNA